MIASAGRASSASLDNTNAYLTMRTSVALIAVLPLALLGIPMSLFRPAPVEPADRRGDDWTQEELELVTRRIESQVEVLRDLEFERPVQVAIADKEAFLRYAAERLEKTETQEELVTDERIAKLLGLIPADMDLLATQLELLEEQVGGFYDPETESFYLMESFTGGMAKVILAHELTHALDDQHFDIDGTTDRVGTTTDREIAFQAVVEGSGTALQNRWILAHPDEFSARELMESQGAFGMETMAVAPPFVWKPLLAVYLRGESFLRKSSSIANLMGRTAKPGNIDQAFVNPPRSTEQILHPKKYWNERSLDEPRELIVEAKQLPDGWEVVAEDTLGELYLAMVAMPMDEREGLDAENPLAVLGIDYTSDAAEGWGGDRLVLLSNGRGHLLHLATVWDSDADAAEFHAAMSELVPALTERMDEVAAALPVEDLDGTESGFRVAPLGVASDEVRLSAFVGLSSSGLDAILDGGLLVREVR